MGSLRSYYLCAAEQVGEHLSVIDSRYKSAHKFPERFFFLKIYTAQADHCQQLYRKFTKSRNRLFLRSGGLQESRLQNTGRAKETAEGLYGTGDE